MPSNTNNSASGRAHSENRLTFEESFARLQEVVTKLSEGNLTLQEALSAYEEGMSLAERCAKMLDDAELRVKQVSERAMRAGSASLADLDQVMRAGTEDDGLVAIDIETFESATLLFDEKPAGGQSSAAQAVAPTDSKSSLRRPAPSIPDDLDPLFDDED